MNSLFSFLTDPFNSRGNAPLSAWRLFLVIGLVFVLIALWGTIFRAIAYAAE